MSLQLNAILESQAGLEILKEVPSLHLPVFWFRTSSAMPLWMATMVWVLSNLTTILLTISVLSIVSGLASLLFLHRRRWKSSTKKTVIPGVSMNPKDKNELE